MNDLPIDIEMAEANAEALYCNTGDRFSTGWATLHIDMTLMSEEERMKVYEAQKLLADAGVRFDTGSGSGGRDWELDWSLSGATLYVRPIHCMSCSEKRVGVWAVYRTPDGRVVRYPYCSETCRKQRDERVAASGYQWELLALMEDASHD